jgi:hypothetical protein
MVPFLSSLEAAGRGQRFVRLTLPCAMGEKGDHDLSMAFVA